MGGPAQGSPHQDLPGLGKGRGPLEDALEPGTYRQALCTTAQDSIEVAQSRLYWAITGWNGPVKHTT